MSSWCRRHNFIIFIINNIIYDKYLSSSYVILKSVLWDISMATSILLWMPFAWRIISTLSFWIDTCLCSWDVILSPKSVAGWFYHLCYTLLMISLQFVLCYFTLWNIFTDSYFYLPLPSKMKAVLFQAWTAVVSIWICRDFSLILSIYIVNVLKQYHIKI